MHEFSGPKFMDFPTMADGAEGSGIKSHANPSFTHRHDSQGSFTTTTALHMS
jgi:hypothetical protein